MGQLSIFFILFFYGSRNYFFIVRKTFLKGAFLVVLCLNSEVNFPHVHYLLFYSVSKLYFLQLFLGCYPIVILNFAPFVRCFNF